MTTNIPEEIRAKLAKIAELAERGATEGERQAARAAMDRVMKAAGIDPEKMGDPRRQNYRFTYATELDKTLLHHIKEALLDEADAIQPLWRYRNAGKRFLEIQLSYSGYMTMLCAYDYFKADMRRKYNATLGKDFKKYRLTERQKKKARTFFITRYIILSGLEKPKKPAPESGMPQDVLDALDKIKKGRQKPVKIDHDDEIALMLTRGVEGGRYRTQLTTEERMIGTSQPTTQQPRPTGQQKLF